MRAVAASTLEDVLFDAIGRHLDLKVLRATQAREAREGRLLLRSLPAVESSLRRSGPRRDVCNLGPRPTCMRHLGPAVRPRAAAPSVGRRVDGCGALPVGDRMGALDALFLVNHGDRARMVIEL